MMRAGLEPGVAYDVGLVDQPQPLLLGLLDDPLCLAAALGDHLVAVLQQVARLPELARQQLLQLVELAQQLGPVDDAGRRHGHGARGLDHRDDLVELDLDILDGLHRVQLSLRLVVRS